MKKVALLLCALGLAGCSETAKVLDKPVLYERAELVVPSVSPVTQSNVSWTIITPQNYEAKIKDIESKGGNAVLFALTPQGYQNLSMNVAELRRYIQQQQAVIGAYQKYYKNEKPQSQQKK